MFGFHFLLCVFLLINNYNSWSEKKLYKYCLHLAYADLLSYYAIGIQSLMRKCHFFSLLLPTLLFYCCLLFLLLIKLLGFFLFGLISFNLTVYMIYKEIMIDHVYKEPICTSYYSPKENELSCPAYWFTMDLMIVLIVGYLYIK